MHSSITWVIISIISQNIWSTELSSSVFLYLLIVRMNDRNQQKRKRGRPRKSAVPSDPKPVDADASSERHKVPAPVDHTSSSGVQTLRLKINLLKASDSGQLEQFPPRHSATPFEILSPEELALRAFEKSIRFLAASKGFRGVRNSLLAEVFHHLDFASLLTSEKYVKLCFEGRNRRWISCTDLMLVE